MLNHIVLMGRLTRDPELRYTQSQIPVASFRLAVDRDFGGRDGGERQTDFIDIVAWRSTAEFVSKYFTKGSMAAVSGRLQIREWTDREGGKRTTAEVVADNVYFGESKRRDGGDTSRPRLIAAAMADMTMSPRAAAHFPSWTTMTAICRSDFDKGGLQSWLLTEIRARTANAEKFASSVWTSALISTTKTPRSFAASCPSAARSCRAARPVPARCISASSPRPSRERVRSPSCRT